MLSFLQKNQLEVFSESHPPLSRRPLAKIYERNRFGSTSEGAHWVSKCNLGHTDELGNEEC